MVEFYFIILKMVEPLTITGTSAVLVLLLIKGVQYLIKLKKLSLNSQCVVSKEMEELSKVANIPK